MSIRFYEQSLGVDGEALAGVQSASLSYQLPYSALTACGTGLVGVEIQGEVVAQLNVETYVVTTGRSFGPNYFDAKEVQLDRKNGNVQIDAAHLTEYTFSATVGEIVRESFAFRSFGEVGEAGTTRFLNTGQIHIARPDGISLSLDEFSTQSVQSVTYAVACPITARRLCGGYTGVPETYRLPPFEVTIDINMNLRGHEFSSMRDQICNPRVETLVIESKRLICEDDPISLRTLSAEGATLIGYSSASSIQENVSVDLQFVAYANSISQLTGWLH